SLRPLLDYRLARARPGETGRRRTELIGTGRLAGRTGGGAVRAALGAELAERGRLLGLEFLELLDRLGVAAARETAAGDELAAAPAADQHGPPASLALHAGLDDRRGLLFEPHTLRKRL